MGERLHVLERFVAEVAARDETAKTSLPPVYEYVDTEALENLFDHADAESERAVTVTFRYAGYEVTIAGDGTLEVDGDVYEP